MDFGHFVNDVLNEFILKHLMLLYSFAETFLPSRENSKYQNLKYDL